MNRVSAGLLVYRQRAGVLEVLLAHPGGPFYSRKDTGVWTIPKGEVAPDEDLLTAARREFHEELGWSPEGPFLPLSAVRQKGGKLVHAWACLGDCDPAVVVSNTFALEWPPGSGRRQEFPEIDRAEFFDLPAAREKLLPAQRPLLDELEQLLAAGD